MPTKIALYSNAPQCGKTTLADRLMAQHSFRYRNLAGPLKNMVDVLFQEAGISDTRYDYYTDTGEGKEEVIPEFGCSYRKLLVAIGTKGIRDHAASALWVDILLAKLREAPQDNVVIDDCRFPNEAEKLQDAGFWLVRIDRRGQTVSADAAGAEGLLADLEPHLVIQNAESNPRWYCDEAVKSLKKAGIL